ncbi:hypothetical protein Gogos_002078 [Gossypium gossypioides]|uniref:Uncharacterized protein n=1 Tax=Gossypium gossypioides TaxID=34282 RepID=A0A7J9CQA0_GOSGO|nr:hypothetical protein [Gossypium gossypioides]
MKEFRGEPSQCYFEGATRALREQVGENVMGQIAKPMTMAQDTPHRGLSIR